MQKCIAFFDSGQGGLTVWEAVLKRFPNLNTIYFGDNARYPYGNKGTDTIIRYASEAVLFFNSKNAELVVVACGTASSVAVRTLRQIYKTPIIGIVENFCLEAVNILGSDLDRTIAILGTRFTVASKRFEEELFSLGAKSVWARACPLLVPLVEEGVRGGAIAEGACEMYLWDIPEDVKVVMLACTHFPRLLESIATTLERRLNRPIVALSSEGQWFLRQGSAGQGDPIYLLDSSSSMVENVSLFLQQKDNKADYFSGKRELFCSDAPEHFAQVSRLFTGITLPPVELVRIGN